MNEMVAFTLIKCCILVMCALIWDHKGKKKTNNNIKNALSRHTLRKSLLTPQAIN